MPRTARVEQVTIEGVALLATLVPGDGVGLLALHGSNEGGTAELAGILARRCGATSLVFTQPGNPRPVHITSPRMAAEHCALLGEFLARVSLTVSLHGHLRAPRTVYLGGRNRAAARVVAEALAARAPHFPAVTDLTAIPSDLRGLHPRNPVNLTRLTGVQVELPLPARTSGGTNRPPDAVVEALAAGVETLGHGGAGNPADVPAGFTD